MIAKVLGIFVGVLALTRAIPVDNGVEGDPEIECGPTSITVNFNTQAPFEGHVYVKGLYATPGCRNDEGGRQVAGITLPFDTCGIIRQRSLNPKGVFVSTTIIVSFHPLFLTKVDRAYKIQCFYMEADKTEPNEECPRPSCAPPAGRGGPRPAGALPPPAANPFPLVAGSNYLPQPGNENPIHGPGNPAAPFAAHPGRPDPNTFHLPGARLDAVPLAQGRPDQPSRGFRPRPSGSRPFNNGGPSFALDTQNVGSSVHLRNLRARRQVTVELLDNAAGTLDVSTEMNALEIDDNVSKVPEAFSRRFPTPGILRSGEGVCFSTSSFAVISTLIILVVMSLATVSTFWLMRQPNKY